jgi:hypothetical protein
LKVFFAETLWKNNRYPQKVGFQGFRGVQAAFLISISLAEFWQGWKSLKTDVHDIGTQRV